MNKHAVMGRRDVVEEVEPNVLIVQSKIDHKQKEQNTTHILVTFVQFQITKWTNCFLQLFFEKN